MGLSRHSAYGLRYFVLTRSRECLCYACCRPLRKGELLVNKSMSTHSSSKVPSLQFFPPIFIRTSSKTRAGFSSGLSANSVLFVHETVMKPSRPVSARLGSELI